MKQIKNAAVAYALIIVCIGLECPAKELSSLQTDTCAPAGTGETCGATAGPPVPVLHVLSSSGENAGKKEEERATDATEPVSLIPLTKIEAGRNDSNPQWSPPGALVAFERSISDKKEIRIVYRDGSEMQTVSIGSSDNGNETKFFLPGFNDETSYNAGITWSPGSNRFIFMSNGGEGNYDLYLQDLGAKAAIRLTDHPEKDGQPDWSHAADRVAFVSGRTGHGDIYILDLPSRALTRLTRGGKPYLHPRWSPDGKKIVMTAGSNENHDILLVGDVMNPVQSMKRLTTWAPDDLRPVWSPDGKNIAFYSNYNAEADPKVWSIVVIASDGSDPSEGLALAGKIVATDVVPDVEVGPAWMPDSARIAYVKNDRHEYNPIYIADIAGKRNIPIKTETRMNHDVSCSRDGSIAFRAQVNQWDQIYVMRLKE